MADSGIRYTCVKCGQQYTFDAVRACLAFYSGEKNVICADKIACDERIKASEAQDKLEYEDGS